MLLHRICLIQSGKNRSRIVEVRIIERKRVQRMHNSDRKESGPNSMATNIQEIHRKVIFIQPPISEGISSQVDRRQELPIGRDFTLELRWKKALHVLSRLKEFLT